MSIQERFGVVFWNLLVRESHYASINGLRLIKAGAMSLPCLFLCLNTLGICQMQDGGKETNVVTPATPQGHVMDGERLVDAIVSQNRPPSIVSKNEEPVFPKEFRWADQDRVKLAIQQLVDHAEEAWPVLVQHLDDKRYCITYDAFDVPRNFSVGDVCVQIVLDYISEGYFSCVPIHSYGTYNILSVPGPATKDVSVLKKWCQERNKKMLFELQTEGCEWAIPVVGRLDTLSGEEKRLSLDAIEERIRMLRASRKAIKVEGFGKRASEEWELYGPSPAEHRGERER